VSQSRVAAHCARRICLLAPPFAHPYRLELLVSIELNPKHLPERTGAWGRQDPNHKRDEQCPRHTSHFGSTELNGHAMGEVGLEPT
jgi:hypothetical protein